MLLRLDVFNVGFDKLDVVEADELNVTIDIIYKSNHALLVVQTPTQCVDA